MFNDSIQEVLLLEPEEYLQCHLGRDTGRHGGLAAASEPERATSDRIGPVGNDASEDQGHDCRKLHDDVQRRATGILQWVTDSVTCGRGDWKIL